MFHNLYPPFIDDGQVLSIQIEKGLTSKLKTRYCTQCKNKTIKTSYPTITNTDMSYLLEVIFENNAPVILDREISIFNHRYSFVAGIYMLPNHFNTIVIRQQGIELAESMRMNDIGQFDTVAQLLPGSLVNGKYGSSKLIRAYYVRS
jgi:hypothetical protein